MAAVVTAFAALPLAAAPLKFTGSSDDSSLLQTAEKAVVARLVKGATSGPPLHIEWMSPPKAVAQAAIASMTGSLSSASATGAQSDLRSKVDGQMRAVTLTELPQDPWFEPAGLVGLAADVGVARSIAQWHGERVGARFRDRFRVRLLAAGAIEAQALYCRQPLRSLDQLKGLRVRTEGLWQAALLEHFGATPLPMPMRDVRASLAAKVIDCAIGGTLSGNQLGWHEASTSLFSLPMGWALTHYLMPESLWNTLEPAQRAQMQAEFRQFEARLWESAALFTREGFNCNAGIDPCSQGRRGKMNIVIATESDRALMKTVMTERVLPAWAARCGPDCAQSFNDAAAHLAGFKPLKR